MTDIDAPKRAPAKRPWHPTVFQRPTLIASLARVVPEPELECLCGTFEAASDEVAAS